jgi:hypothetical protein
MDIFCAQTAGGTKKGKFSSVSNFPATFNIFGPARTLIYVLRYKPVSYL